MNNWIRGRENFAPHANQHASALWGAIESLVKNERRMKPFEDLSFSEDASSDYLPSQERKSRYELVEGHSRYKSDTASVSSKFGAEAPLGPVELELLGFADSPHPVLLVLLGGMGSGKSTTIKYLQSRFLGKYPDYKVSLCDLDADIFAKTISDKHLSEIGVAQVLASCLSKKLDLLIEPNEEYTKLWTWALSDDAFAVHPAKNILSSAQQTLRSELGDHWRSESEAAIDLRKKAHAKLAGEPALDLSYQALRIDYYLTCCCKGDRSRFILILDNVDPLAPRIQYSILDLASRVQTMSRCKLLVSLRPLTYSSNLQGANRIMEVVEHFGPSVIDFIVHRIRKTVLESDLSKLSVKTIESGRPDRTIGEREARRWIEEVVNTLSREPRQTVGRGDTSARAFIEGICGHSLRSALVVAPKIFGSPVTSTLDLSPQGSPRARVRDHDVVRAIVDGWRGYFQAEPGRVTDNIFDLGDMVTSKSCTSKVRLLKKLHSAHNQIVSIGEIRQHLSSFGYSDVLILDTVNSSMSQTKRLAWSDSVARYEALDGHNNSRLKLSSAGSYYIEHAIFSLEYVQGVHVDVLLPREETLEHDQRNFAERLRSLELFARYLCQQDLREVKQMMLNPQEDYLEVYGAALFSVEMIEALEKQVRTIGGSMLGPRASHERREEVARTIERWNSLMLSVQQECGPILSKLECLRARPSERIGVRSNGSSDLGRAG